MYNKKLMEALIVKDYQKYIFDLDYTILIPDWSKEDEYLKNISEILKCFKIKFIIYFIMSFSFLIFYWYFISSFCAVYENTQIIYIEDSLSSFAMSLLYSFLKLLIFSLCRFIALRCNKDSIVCECLYKFGA